MSRNIDPNMDPNVDPNMNVAASQAPVDVAPARSARAWLRGVFSTHIEKSDRRIRIIAFGFALIYCVIGGKLI